MDGISFHGGVYARRRRAPGPGLAWRLRNLRHAVRGWRGLVAPRTGFPAFTAALSARVIRSDGGVINYGVVSRRKLTQAFVNYMVDALQSSEANWINFKYHDSGTGTASEDNTDTGLQTASGLDREVGTQVEGASDNIYRSVATITYDDDYAITEHGLFNQAEGGVLMDRSVFAAINVGNGDSIQFTYELLCNPET